MANSIVVGDAVLRGPLEVVRAEALRRWRKRCSSLLNPAPEGGTRRRAVSRRAVGLPMIIGERAATQGAAVEQRPS